MKPPRVVVVGAGIAGLCVAYYLRKRDAEVIVLDSGPVGGGASFANGGWIAPAQGGPLPEPGLTIYGLRALLNADSALYFKPGQLPRLLPWLLRFWTYCNDAAYRQGTEALAALGRRAFSLVDGMVADGVAFELYKLGMLCATGGERDALKVLDGLTPMRQLGFQIPGELMVGEELRAFEPALSPRVRAGFFVDEHWHVRSSSLTAGLASALRRDGVRIEERTPVTGFDVRGTLARAVVTGDRNWPADAVVIAAGSWTSQLARMLGIRLPMQPGKGYTFMVTPKVMPRHAILFADIHAGATPLGNRLRVGGTMEFSGFDLGIDERRISSVFRLARDYVDLVDPAYDEAWAGLRPIAADGLPILDRAGPTANVYLATGYSMLGMTLGAPAGEAIASIVTTGDRPAILEPFRLDRFGRRGSVAA